jgi:hypothetical protein
MVSLRTFAGEGAARSGGLVGLDPNYPFDPTSVRRMSSNPAGTT